MEQIAGSVLVSSGGADDIWPSALMAEAVVQRLKAKGFPYEVKHLHYPAAGHAVFGELPDKNDKDAVEKLTFGGGTPIGNYEAREQRWLETMTFLKGGWRGRGLLSFYEFRKYP